MKKRGTHSAKTRRLWAVLGVFFWIALWCIAARFVGKEVLLPSPARVAARLAELCRTAAFYQSVFNSLWRILLGFAAGAFTALWLGLLAARFAPLRGIIAPMMTVIRATPVASFIILALVFLGKELVPGLICFLMVLPVVYGAVGAGLESRDAQLCEMLKVFAVQPLARLRYYELPRLMHFFGAGCRTALGLAWKAGVAAEVLCTPARTIGKNLYDAKIYIETVDVFAWTAVIVLLSLCFEALLRLAFDKMAGGGKTNEHTD